jgi:serine/threonine protein kinase
MAFSFVRSLVKHTLEHGGNALGGGIVPIGSIASAIYAEWCESGEKPANDQAPPVAEQARVRAELEKIVQDPRAYRAQVDQLLGQLGAGQPEVVRQAARSYLNQIPGRVQRSLRRPEDPSGRTVPAGLVLRRAEDLKQLLPERMPRFQPGARPVPGTDLVVQELLGVGGFGEVWKAIHQSRPHAPAVALKFCIDETAARTLRKEVELLDRVSRQGRHRGIVELRYAHLEGDTPCLEYEYVDGGDLAGLVVDLHRAGKMSPLNMTRLFLTLAQAVGFAHCIAPPIVHRDLKPTNVLTTRVENRVLLKVLDFGIGGIVAEQDKRGAAETVGQWAQTTSAGTCTPLYASPQQRRGAGPDPRDDVYALGVIWYQMLLGDVTKEPPRGGSWKKRLLEQGATPNMLDLLERCLEDDPDDRPADAQVLTQELQAIVKEAAPPGPESVPPVPVPPIPEAAPASLGGVLRQKRKEEEEALAAEQGQLREKLAAQVRDNAYPQARTTVEQLLRLVPADPEALEIRDWLNERLGERSRRGAGPRPETFTKLYYAALMLGAAVVVLGLFSPLMWILMANVSSYRSYPQNNTWNYASGSIERQRAQEEYDRAMKEYDRAMTEYYRTRNRYFAVAMVGTVLGLLALIAQVVIRAVFLGLAWRIVQDGHAPTTPGAAVGRMFIPLYNAVWCFRSWRGLARTMNDVSERLAVDGPLVSEGLALTWCILFVLLYLPYLNFVALPAAIIVGLILLNQMRHTAGAIARVTAPREEKRGRTPSSTR